MSRIPVAVIAGLVFLAHAPLRAEEPAPAPEAPPPPDELERARRRAALREYDLHRISFDDLVSYGEDSGVSAGGTQPYLGKYHQPLEPDEFLDLVGRGDLARGYRVRWWVRTGLLVGAVAGTLVAGGEGMRLLLSGSGASSCDASSPQFSACTRAADQAEAEHVRDGVLLVTAASALGPLLITGVALCDPNPVPGWQMRQLADEYNARLRARLGLPEDEQDLRSSVLGSVRVEPFASPWGGGLVLRGGF